MRTRKTKCVMRYPQRVYISGPMTGVSREVFAARFAEAERVLTAAGFEVVNPARFWVGKLYPLLGYELVLLYDLWRLMRCNLIYQLPGYNKSRGSMIEGAVSYNLNIYRLHHVEKARIDSHMRAWMKENEIKEGETKKAGFADGGYYVNLILNRAQQSILRRKLEGGGGGNARTTISGEQLIRRPDGERILRPDGGDY